MEDRPMDTNVIITFLACVFALFLLGRVLVVPLKTILKIILNSILGGFLIYIVNLIGAGYSFHIGLNFFTAIFVGVLGIPGALLLAILKLFF